MDVVLEVLDTFGFDWLYATLLPASSPFNAGRFHDVSNSSLPSMLYKPASQYLKLEPSQYAYMSALPRDNVWRQGITLYLITWSVALFCFKVEEKLKLVY